MALMQKITIAGNAASGKSTLSEELGLLLGLPVYHLDLIQFRPGWQKTPPELFEQQHEEWLQQDRWIIEGVAHWQPLVKRFHAADTIIYLDFPVEHCLQRARKRLEQDLLQPSPYLPENCPYALKAAETEQVIRFFHREWTPKILKLLEQLKHERTVYIFRTEQALQHLKDSLQS